MNGKRIVTGGLLAGVVIIVAEIAAEPFLGKMRAERFAELGLTLPGEATMGALLVMPLLVGIVMVWLYAHLRKHYGAGPRTAVMAGATVWFLECLSPSVALAALGILPGRLFLVTVLYVLLVAPLAALAGAKIYREPADAPVRRTAASTLAGG